MGYHIPIMCVVYRLVTLIHKFTELAMTTFHASKKTVCIHLGSFPFKCAFLTQKVTKHTLFPDEVAHL